MGFVFRKILLLIGDVLLLYCSLVFSLVIGFWGRFDVSILFQHILPFSLLYVIWLVIFYVMNLYDLSLPPTSSQYLTRYVGALIILFGTGVLFFYVGTIAGITPKTNLLIHVINFGVLAYFWRIIFSTRISPLMPWRIGLFSLGSEGTELKETIEAFRHHGYECVFLTDEPLREQIKRFDLDVVVLPFLSFNSGSSTETLYDCLGTGVTFLDYSEAYELFARRIPLSTVDQRWFIHNVHERGQGFSNRLKRFFDVLIAALIILLSIPLWGIIAIAILLDGNGEIFYSQERVGKNCRTFFIKKFRTMRLDAEAQGAQWAQKDDSRVTKVGKILRRTHLDELPQMLNVLKGDLSLVGPRPERPMFVEQLEKDIPHYRVRHFIKPGFTGWAQIKFRYARSVVDSQRKFEYDLYYIKNRSFILDVLILLKTVQLLFRKEK